jgi:hypothetical protein
MFGLTLLGLAAGSAAVPAVIFSPSSPLGATGYRELPTAVDQAALQSTIEGLLGQRSAVPALVESSTQQPVVLLDAKGADSSSMQSLIQTVGPQGSAVGLPYTASVPADASLFQGADTVVATSAAELDQALAGRTALPRLLVVRSPDAFSLLSKVNTVSSNYVAVALAKPSFAQTRQLAEKKEAKAESPQLILVTPTILTGLLAGLVWLTIFFAGTCCLMNLHTPDRFEEKCLQLNKEY